MAMRKKALLSLAFVLALALVGIFLTPSVAALKNAASASVARATKSSSSPPRASLLYGPRRHQVRNRAAVAVSGPPIVTATPKTMVAAPVVRVPGLKKTHLEQMIDQSGVSEMQRPLALAVLGLLAPECQEKLETFKVLYNNPDHRGLAGRGVIIVTGQVSDEEFMGLLMHEGLGHFREITCLTGTAKAGASEFRDGADPIYNDDPSVFYYRISWLNDKKRKPAAKPEDFPTGYGFEADNFEDLAEGLTLYMTQEQTFRLRAATNTVMAQKLRWFETYMPKQNFVAQGSPWDGTIPWDATKLPFTLADAQ